MKAGRAAVVLSAAVMCHPARRTGAERLVRDLGTMAATLAVDPEPDAPASSARSAALAWHAIPAWSTHHLVLEDDALLAPGFVDVLPAFVRRKPHAAIGLFANWSSHTGAVVRAAAVRGASWAGVIEDYMPTQGLVLPADVGRALADFLDHEWHPAEPGDMTVLRGLHGLGVEAVVTAPNLVEHATLGSLIGNDAHGLRRSCCFLADTPNISVDDRRLTVPCIPYLSETAGRAMFITTASDGLPGRAEAMDVLIQLGASETDLDHGFTAAVRSVRQRFPGAWPVDPSALFEIWLTGVALGALVGRLASPSDPAISDLLASPMAKAALESLAPGGLHGFVAPQLLLACKTAFGEVAAAAVGWGVDRLGSGPALTDDNVRTAPQRLAPPEDPRQGRLIAE